MITAGIDLLKQRRCPFVNKITKKSSNILNVFKKTQDELIIANSEIDIEIEEQQKIKHEADTNIQNLSVLKTQHQGVIDKIKNFLITHKPQINISHCNNSAFNIYSVHCENLPSKQIPAGFLCAAGSAVQYQAFRGFTWEAPKNDAR